MMWLQFITFSPCNIRSCVISFHILYFFGIRNLVLFLNPSTRFDRITKKSKLETYKLNFSNTHCLGSHGHDTLTVNFVLFWLLIICWNHTVCATHFSLHTPLYWTHDWMIQIFFTKLSTLAQHFKIPLMTASHNTTKTTTPSRHKTPFSQYYLRHSIKWWIR